MWPMTIVVYGLALIPKAAFGGKMAATSSGRNFLFWMKILAIYFGPLGSTIAFSEGKTNSHNTSLRYYHCINKYCRYPYQLLQLLSSLTTGCYKKRLINENNKEQSIHIGRICY